MGDRNGIPHSIPNPLTAEIHQKLRSDLEAYSQLKEEDTDGDGKPDHPTILSEIPDHFHSIYHPFIGTRILEQEAFGYRCCPWRIYTHTRSTAVNMETQQWNRTGLKPTAVIDAEGTVTQEAVYKTVDDVNIPIDDQGRMVINFMVPRRRII